MYMYDQERISSWYDIPARGLLVHHRWDISPQPAPCSRNKINVSVMEVKHTTANPEQVIEI